ncbi:STAS domain-containing protein [Actinoplanes sp. NPDC051861]|uniref:STAS domain-containing protein n=1 Tax=Actinoplanes sp. NPDC051861 TaxID=3155170 RepID=UPI00341D89CE
MCALIAAPRGSLRGVLGELYGGQNGQLPKSGGLMGEAAMTTRRQADGAIVVEVRGSLDAATVAGVRSSLLGALQRGRPRQMIVDLTFVTFMDSMGIGALIAGHEAARNIGCRFTVRNPSDFVDRQLRVTGLSDLLGLRTHG